jgi:nucleotide-binding universal stress UspA family protein
MKNILVPIDFSDATSRVLELARQLGKSFGAEIHIVHVRPIPAPLPASPLGYGALGMPEMVPGPVSQVVAQPIEPNEEEKKKLNEWKTEMERAGLSATVHEPTGDVVEEILECAQKMKADAIVMGRHGHGAMYNLLVGSVTEGVLKRSTCPVLLVPSGARKKS